MSVRIQAKVKVSTRNASESEKCVNAQHTWKMVTGVQCIMRDNSQKVNSANLCAKPWHGYNSAFLFFYLVDVHESSLAFGHCVERLS